MLKRFFQNLYSLATADKDCFRLFLSMKIVILGMV